MADQGPIIVELPPLVIDDDKPMTDAELEEGRQILRDLDLSSCDFVGDYGCCDLDCWRCHSPLRPENLRTLAENIAMAAMLCRAWGKRDEDPSWRPGCNLREI